ncbi:hypothetical protein PsorP6_012158 [Peronosclerospora sorghi]|uniref:Uncharacterized protein n=1 Tax=Peronosclerospora sorghi TaxID=230839 RepID=A0ACC0WIP8_9STRA|nr:hypothetical protein PsorP6_012158 [Peronosclerospora sorghi]
MAIVGSSPLAIEQLSESLVVRLEATQLSGERERENGEREEGGDVSSRRVGREDEDYTADDSSTSRAWLTRNEGFFEHKYRPVMPRGLANSALPPFGAFSLQVHRERWNAFCGTYSLQLMTVDVFQRLLVRIHFIVLYFKGCHDGVNISVGSVKQILGGDEMKKPPMLMEVLNFQLLLF